MYKLFIVHIEVMLVVEDDTKSIVVEDDYSWYLFCKSLCSMSFVSLMKSSSTITFVQLFKKPMLFDFLTYKLFIVHIEVMLVPN